MRMTAFALFAALVPGVAAAVPSRDWSAIIAAKGLAATGIELAALPAPSADDLFALGAVRFLDGIEGALQARWSIGQTDDIGLLPVLRLPLPANPNPAPLDPALIETTLVALQGRMEAARAALGAIPPMADVALTVRPADLWFDVNRSGARDPGEGVAEIAGFLFAAPGFPAPEDAPEDAAPLPGGPALPPITFDAADTAWLSAYTNLLSGTADMVLAFQPTAPLRKVAEGRAAMAKAGVTGPLDTLIYGGVQATRFPSDIDLAAIVILTLRQQPLADRTHAARDHFLAMIADNRRFWSLADQETDNSAEWIPNARQTAWTGTAFPKGIDIAWPAVLGDFEQLLTGGLLIPYQDNAGFDLAAWLDHPAPVDLVEWLHGMGLQPWLKPGPQVSPENGRIFTEMVGGDALLFAVYLN